MNRIMFSTVSMTFNRTSDSSGRGFRADNGLCTVRVDGKVAILPKIGPVQMVERLRFAGSIREVIINRTAGTWFACF